MSHVWTTPTTLRLDDSGMRREGPSARLREVGGVWFRIPRRVVRERERRAEVLRISASFEREGGHIKLYDLNELLKRAYRHVPYFPLPASLRR